MVLVTGCVVDGPGKRTLDTVVEDDATDGRRDVVAAARPVQREVLQLHPPVVV
jgi:hypothetical protein